MPDHDTPSSPALDHALDHLADEILNVRAEADPYGIIPVPSGRLGEHATALTQMAVARGFLVLEYADALVFVCRQSAVVYGRHDEGQDRTNVVYKPSP